MFWNKQYLYLQVKEGIIEAKEVISGISMSKKCNGLAHPRSLMGDFTSIESCFREIVKTISPVRFLAPAPTVLVHLRPEAEGGYTNVEIRAFREAAYGAGAREVFMPKKNSMLSKTQIMNKDFEEFDSV